MDKPVQIQPTDYPVMNTPEPKGDGGGTGIVNQNECHILAQVVDSFPIRSHE